MTPTEEIPLYKGYINYFKNEDLLTLKTHNFRETPKETVTRLKMQFKNPEKYRYVGKKVALEEKPEKTKKS